MKQRCSSSEATQRRYIIICQQCNPDCGSMVLWAEMCASSNLESASVYRWFILYFWWQMPNGEGYFSTTASGSGEYTMLYNHMST